jgi:hypothetical protein
MRNHKLRLLYGQPKAMGSQLKTWVADLESCSLAAAAGDTLSGSKACAPACSCCAP